LFFSVALIKITEYRCIDVTRGGLKGAKQTFLLILDMLGLRSSYAYAECTIKTILIVIVM